MQCGQCGATNPMDAPNCVQCGSVTHTAAKDAEIWNPNATANWSLLFTPAFGAYLQALNWRALGEPEKAAASMRWFRAGIAIMGGHLLIALSLAPSIGEGLSRLIGFAFLLTWYFRSGRAQSKHVKDRFGNDYLRKPWGKALLYGVGAMVAYMVLAGVIAVLAGAMSATGGSSEPGF